jgi:hypothetical protein
VQINVKLAWRPGQQLPAPAADSVFRADSTQPDMNKSSRLNSECSGLLAQGHARLRALSGLVFIVASSALFAAQAHNTMMLSATVLPVAPIHMASDAGSLRAVTALQHSLNGRRPQIVV